MYIDELIYHSLLIIILFFIFILVAVISFSQFLDRMDKGLTVYYPFAETWDLVTPECQQLKLLGVTDRRPHPL